MMAFGLLFRLKAEATKGSGGFRLQAEGQAAFRLRIASADSP